MKIIMASGILLLLVSCTSISNEIIKLDNATYQAIYGGKKTLDCDAGIANGLVLGVNTDAGSRTIAKELKDIANISSEDYKRCFGKAAYWIFWKKMAKEEAGALLKDLISLGVSVPLPIK